MHIYRLLDGPNLAGLLSLLSGLQRLLSGLHCNSAKLIPTHHLGILQSAGVSSAG